MSADNDGDSQMISSPEDSDLDTTRTPITPNLHSPPDSSHRSMPISASGATGANANGKRPINTISNGTEDADAEELAAMQYPVGGASSSSIGGPGGGKGRQPQEFPTKTHQASGYSWNRTEDEPGHAWLNKKALDEYHRAWDSLVHRESMVKARYGDPFEAADKEKAMLNSLKQQ